MRLELSNAWAVAVALVLAAAVIGCAMKRPAAVAPVSPRQKTITAIKRVEKDLGFGDTGNFLRSSNKIQAYYRCYYTDILTLPDSYEDLQLKEGNEAGCSLDESKYDVFFYRIEAVASGDVPITPALEEATIDRLAVVVPHEDFHTLVEIKRLPTRVGESAATLAGFLTASEFAKRQYGETSQTYNNLSKEAELYLKKSRIVNSYHKRLRSLYDSVRSGKLSQEEALTEKSKLYSRLQAECETITPEPNSFNKCLAANNNAGLAFDATYTTYYPLLYQLYIAQGRDLKTFIRTMKQPGRQQSLPEAKAVRYFEDIIRKQNGSAVSNHDAARDLQGVSESSY